MSRPRTAERNLDTPLLVPRGDYSISVSMALTRPRLRVSRPPDGRVALGEGRVLRVSRPRTAERNLDTSLLVPRGDYSISVSVALTRPRLRVSRPPDGRVALGEGRVLRVSRPRTAERNLDTSLLVPRGDYSITDLPAFSLAAGTRSPEDGRECQCCRDEEGRLGHLDD